jgi:ribose transport system substrate-binding protein
MKDVHSGPRSRRIRIWAGVVGGLLVAGLLTACAGASTTSAAGPAVTAKATGACGTTVPVGPSNPNGIYKTFSPTLKALYSVYPNEVNASPWANWKGVKPPWRLGYIDFASGTPFTSSLYSELTKLYAQGVKQGLLKGSLAVSIPASATTATAEEQINAIQQMVREGVNAIILSPIAGSSEASAIDAAGKAGVPILLADNIIAQSKYGISVYSQNQYEDVATWLGIVKKGNVLAVRGLAGNESEGLLYGQLAADLKNCPDIHLAGTVYGNWNASTAKTVVSQYLVSHPATLDGVFQDGAMMPGIVEAFEAGGKTVPPIADGECEGSDLSWWLTNIKNGYQGAGGCFNGAQGGYTYFNAILRVLDGKGISYNVTEIPAPLITNANVAQYATPNQPLSWDGEMRGPTNAWCSNSCLDKYFSVPGAVGNF